jgi:hypothetical protein
MRSNPARIGATAVTVVGLAAVTAAPAHAAPAEVP